MYPLISAQPLFRILKERNWLDMHDVGRSYGMPKDVFGLVKDENVFQPPLDTWDNATSIAIVHVPELRIAFTGLTQMQAHHNAFEHIKMVCANPKIAIRNLSWNYLGSIIINREPIYSTVCKPLKETSW